MKPTESDFQLTSEPPASLAVQEPSVAAMMSAIIERGITPESVAVMERLVALKERMDEKAAEREFAKAFAALQGELKSFRATKTVPDKHGNARYTYLPYDEIMAAVNPLAQAHGISISFSTDFRDSRIIQTCTLQHSSGHHRDYQAFVRAGAGPYGATETQADGAAMTYAKRYALCNALNIVVDRMDTDGVSDDARNEGTGVISSDKVQYLREQIKETGSNEAKLLEIAGVKRWEDCPDGIYPVIVRALAAKARRA